MGSPFILNTKFYITNLIISSKQSMESILLILSKHTHSHITLRLNLYNSNYHNAIALFVKAFLVFTVKKNPFNPHNLREKQNQSICSEIKNPDEKSPGLYLKFIKYSN